MVTMKKGANRGKGSLLLLVLILTVVCIFTQFSFLFTYIDQQKQSITGTATTTTTNTKKKTTTKTTTTTTAYYNNYVPSPAEEFVTEHAIELSYSVGKIKKRGDGCNLWKNSSSYPSNQISEILHQEGGLHESLQQYMNMELPKYNRLIKEFTKNKVIKDVRRRIREDGDYSVCNSLKLHPRGLEGLFPSGVLSKLEEGGGYMEPMLPPFRHPSYCTVNDTGHFYEDHKDVVLDMGFLIHDFHFICRNKVKPYSRFVFVDMGASLDIHLSDNWMDNPAFYLTELYERFGFPFDHIYAYELTPKDPEHVYRQIPNKLKASYHWYNVGVNSSLDSPNNPLVMLSESFTEDDFIVMKLDIDTAWIEVPMVKLLLEEQKLSKLIDVIYFEHHVFMKDMARYWRKTMSGSILDSFNLFTGLRKLGIMAHSWV